MAPLRRNDALRAIGLHSWRTNASQRLLRHETCLAAKTRRDVATLRQSLRQWRAALAPPGRIPTTSLIVLLIPLSLRGGFRVWGHAAARRSRRTAAWHRGRIFCRCIVLGSAFLSLSAHAGRSTEERRLRVTALEHLAVSSLSRALARGAAPGARMRQLRVAGALARDA
jgi:hypothetical protein